MHIAARRSATAVTEPGFYLLSTVEVLNRTASEGRGWLLKFAENGTALGALRIGVGASYHPGGMDSDGRFVYVLHSLNPLLLFGCLFLSIPQQGRVKCAPCGLL